MTEFVFSGRIAENWHGKCYSAKNIGLGTYPGPQRYGNINILTLMEFS